MLRSIWILFRRHSELMVWSAGLCWLALTDPYGGHFSFCLLKLSGITWCPGCGLGHAIGFLFHGEWRESVAAHPLGIPALFFILLRMYRLIKTIFQQHSNHGIDGSVIYESSQP